MKCVLVDNPLESGWVEGSDQDFLGLSDADMLIIETRLAACRLLKVWGLEGMALS